MTYKNTGKIYLILEALPNQNPKQVKPPPNPNDLYDENGNVKLQSSQKYYDPVTGKQKKAYHTSKDEAKKVTGIVKGMAVGIGAGTVAKSAYLSATGSVSGAGMAGLGTAAATFTIPSVLVGVAAGIGTRLALTAAMKKVNKARLNKTRILIKEEEQKLQIMVEAQKLERNPVKQKKMEEDIILKKNKLKKMYLIERKLSLKLNVPSEHPISAGTNQTNLGSNSV